jgi:protein SCO1
MSKTAIVALVLAVLLPAAGYISVKVLSKDAVQMPGHYFEPDSIVTRTAKGKTVTDTVWHRVRNLQMTNQLGQSVSLDDIKDKILIIDLFFTRCASICPRLARTMKKLQDSYAKSDSMVHFLSVSIDPERDSVPRLRRFADRFNVNHDNWWLVTGNKEAIYDFALSELKASIADTTITPDFVHTDLFFLLDKKRVVRGFYHEGDTAAMAKLAKDISLLMLEKDRTKPSFFRNFIPILPVIFIGIALVFIVMWILNQRKKQNPI